MFDIEHKNQLRRRKQMEEELVFHTSNGRRRNDSNLLDRYLKPAGTKLGMPWLKWHTLRDAQEQVGHSKMSTILEIWYCYSLISTGHSAIIPHVA